MFIYLTIIHSQIHCKLHEREILLRSLFCIQHLPQFLIYSRYLRKWINEAIVLKIIPFLFYWTQIIQSPVCLPEYSVTPPPLLCIGSHSKHDEENTYIHTLAVLTDTCLLGTKQKTKWWKTLCLRLSKWHLRTPVDILLRVCKVWKFFFLLLCVHLNNNLKF